ncbi:efflux RND transporter permease subunit [Cesiribacter andamanensis]|uniref:Multidrug transporter MdtC n=1 Tax=Cesiribacter andamanensis AMV16 TaxID=1279009 RepID=M7MZX5_9BACT|nr:efflux RND transporter permease subunit [Cesiribacter andamanensis]EMR01988.1 Multidrug transporter MdtC [Cesiribacter andamanensis AMV16]
MKIATYAVKNYQFTLVIFLMIVALGVTTLLTMSRSEDPEIRAPQFPIVIIYPGTSPQDMEELVVDPIEKKISELEDIKKIKSTISDGVAVIEVHYKYESDVDNKHQELIREVSGMRQELPRDIYSIDVKKISPSDVNILQLGLVSENASRAALKKAAEGLQKELEKIPALKNVEIWGLPNEIVRVDLRLEKLAHLGLPLNAVLGSLQSEMANIPGGSLEAGTKAFNIKTGENFNSAEDVANTIVYAAGGKNILLKEVAEVQYDHEEEKHITRLNGHRAVFVTAAQKSGNNISQVQQAYLPVLEAYGKSLPANIELVQNFDQAANVNRRLGQLGTDFLIAILLVSITLLPLGGRAAFIVMISIPLSLAIGLVLLNVMGYNLNQLSIVGLVVALGLLVDDSIVVVENIERWLRQGHSRVQATLMATKQIGLAVVGCTVTLIIAFMPLVFMPEGAGDFIRSLPMAVISSVLASMLVSLTIIPFLASRLLKEKGGHPEGNLFMRSIQTLIHRSYAPLLNRALQRPLLSLLVAAVLFGGSLLLFPVIGFSLFPMSEKPQFLVNVKAPLQANLAYTNAVAREVEAELGNIPDVTYYATNVGKGNPRIYYNVIPENERQDFAQIFVQLKENTSMARKLEITEALRQRFSRYPDAKIEVKNFEQGPPMTAPIEVRLAGNNLDSLRILAARVEGLLKNTEGTLYVTNPVANLKSDIKVDINKEKARMLGVSSVDIARTVRLAIAGIAVGTFSDADGEDRAVVVTTPKGERATLAAFDHLHVNTAQGGAVPLKQLADLSLDASPLTINHYDKTRMVSVSAFVHKDLLLDRVLDDVIEKMDKLELPEGYSYSMGGEIESRQESFGGFGTVIIVTVFLFIAVLVLEFKTFKSTLIVLSVIPLGIVGAVLALLLTGNSLSFVAIIGLIALAGIEVKNSILLVDFTNQLRQQGRSLEEAIREAGEVRFLPIVLTSLTAIGGLLPIALSSNPLISPLAIVLIGGLISSTLLSRIVTPVVYKLIPPLVEGPEEGETTVVVQEQEAVLA